MRIALERLKRICAEQKLTLSELLQTSGVSRNAFYSLARQDSILPRSIRTIAHRLQVPPSSFLIDDGSDIQKGLSLISQVQEIVTQHADIDPDNIRHTLILLQERPIDRLRRALRRAGRINIQQ